MPGLVSAQHPSCPDAPDIQRATRRQLLARDEEVAGLAEELRRDGRPEWTELATRIEKCHAASIRRARWRSDAGSMLGADYQYRCKTLACPGCRRSVVRNAQKQSFHHFHGIDGDDASLVTIVLARCGDMAAVREVTRRGRRRLRDLRDELAGRSPAWSATEFSGYVELDAVPADCPSLLSERQQMLQDLPAESWPEAGGVLLIPHAHVVCHHPGVSRANLERVLMDAYPGARRVDVASFHEDLPAEDSAANITGYALKFRFSGLSIIGEEPWPMRWRALVLGALFEWRRGLEPLRVAIGRQAASASGLHVESHHLAAEQRRVTEHEPMPFVIA